MVLTPHRLQSETLHFPVHATRNVQTQLKSTVYSSRIPHSISGFAPD